MRHVNTIISMLLRIKHSETWHKPKLVVNTGHHCHNPRVTRGPLHPFPAKMHVCLELL